MKLRTSAKRAGAALGSLALASAMLFAVTGAAVAADSTYTWLGNGYPNQSCGEDPGTMLWIWTGDSPTSLTINGVVQSGSWVQMGGGSYHFTVNVDGANYPPTSASITYSGDAGTLTLSGCDEGGTAPSESPSGSGAGATDTPAPTETAAPTDTPAPTETAAPTDTPAPTDTAAPTGTPEGTGAGATDTPVPSGGGAGDTDQPTQPPTDGLASNGSGPSDGAWLLVVGLGVLLASIVVLTPARVKSRR